MKIKIQESKLQEVLKRMVLEQEKPEKQEEKQRCVSTNVVSINDIAGNPTDYKNYTTDLYRRDGGVNGMADTLDILKTIRLHPNIKDGGEHLSYELMNHLNSFRGRKYFDETNSQCLPAMDKIIELYRENEHGEDLVKDIEKVLAHHDPTARAKEYLKRCLVLIKEK
jgi:hypothetical protein